MKINIEQMSKLKITLILLITLSFLGVLCFYFCDIASFLFPSQSDRTGELVKLILSALGGGCLLYGLYINNKRAKSTEKNVKNQEEQLRLTLKSQIDDRFKNAIEHLGDDKEPIILGGVAELNQIVKEDSNKYAEVVFNILCSYIRSETNIYKKIGENINATIVNTIIGYLFKNTPNNPYATFRANLSHSNLANQEIENCNLKGADLSFSHFGSIENNVLDYADLSGAELFCISFEGNSMNGVKLSKTKFTHTKFENITFKSFTTLEKHSISPYCTDCTFVSVNFDDITISGAIFIGCVFRDCTFRNSEILLTNFYACTFINTSFANTEILSSIDFSASVFNNFKLNGYASRLIFKGCSISKNPNNYVFVKEQINEGMNVSSTVDSLDFGSSHLIDCIFGRLTDKDKQIILDKYNELTETKQMPLKR